MIYYPKFFGYIERLI